MGSGCINSSPGKYCPVPVSSNCVTYQGDPVPLLGICTGDTITEVEQAIIEKLLSVLDGTGIVLSGVTVQNCQYLKDRLAGKDQTLLNLIQLLIDSECNLKALIDEINTKLNPGGNNYVFDLKCVTLPTLPPNTPVTSDHVLQGTINTVCALKAQVDQLQLTVNNITNTTNESAGNLLKNAIVGCTGIKTTGTGAAVQIDLIGMTMPYMAIPYWGPLGWFDNTGKGLPGTPACNWFLCNGNNGTIDMKGFIPVGAIQGIGGTINPLVDPTGDATLNYQVGVAGGASKVSITKSNLPDYPLTGSFNIQVGLKMWQKNSRHQSSSSQNWSYGPNATGDNASLVTVYSEPATGTITMNLGGGSQPIDVRQPYLPVAYVTRFE